MELPCGTALGGKGANGKAEAVATRREVMSKESIMKLVWYSRKSVIWVYVKEG
jgi:hypothetical protein